ncbi:iron chelate uptake ABC transporter family permease subunit [Neorhizobium sp. JUb45]|uniref:FecCD family ABC transporter permease n=1 Tax=unclassified Neorhizobium TaxID=2629175 RepID=UPI0010E2824B|nr:iron chelate uptake ABC transporter family permease subunit [Neorhizobium sp. JUb45]TCR05015.1 iron complex transport system permease protein [Neorhizobium sp. JUb45]
MNLHPSFMRRRLTIRAFGDRVGMSIDKRLLLAYAIFVTLAFAIVIAALVSGQVRIPVMDVIDVLLGNGQRRTRLVVLEWRMPRAAAAALFGALLGLGGAVFQSITRNPLGSPDVVGFDAGAYTGAILAITFAGGGWLVLAGSAIAGGLLTAFAVYLLTWHKGIQGFQLIVVGIGVSAMLTSANHWILIKSTLSTAMAANTWGMGSLARVSSQQLLPALWVAVPVIIAALVLSRPLRLMEMGDARARALGIRVETVRLSLMALAIVATALVTAMAGPIPFVALAAPPIAHAITRTAGTSLAASMLTGALLLSAADYVAQHSFSPIQLPVGVVTLCIGGAYFLWLIVKEARRT